MATEKIINTRIQLKYDTLANWNANSSLILRKGEVGICAIPTSSSHLQTTPPAIMFKVGDGVVDAQGTVTGTQFKDLPWASALAADVYAWAKKSVPDVNDFGDIIAAAREGLISADSVVKTLNGLKGVITLEGDSHITVTTGTDKVTFAFTMTDAEKAALDSGITSTLVKKYDEYDGKITAVTTTANNALPQATFDTFKIENTAAIEAAKKAGTDAADALSAYQTSNDDAVAGKVDKTTTINGHALSDNVTLSKGDIELGNVENKTLDTAVTASSGNYITSGAVKSYVDSAIGAVKQFKYEVVNELPSAAAATMGKIYLVAHTHEGTQDGYDEFITIEKDGAYSWEKIGNTDIDLSQYVNGISGTANNGVITDISKDGNTITVTSKSLASTVADTVKQAGNSVAFVTGFAQTKDGKVSVTTQDIPVASTTQAGIVKAGTTKGKVYGVDVAADGAMTVNVPWENTQNANTWRNITLDGTAYKGTSTDTGALDLRHGNNIDLSIDSTTKGVVIAAKNQTVKVGTATFGADDAVEIKGDKDTNVSVEANATAKTITIKGKSDADINSLIDTKIGGLDVSNITGFGAGKTLKTLTETDGKIAATFQDIAITASQVSDFATAAETQIKTHLGVDKVGTVTNVSAGVGLKVSTGSTTPKVEIDDSVVFVFNCGSATELVD